MLENYINIMRAHRKGTSVEVRVNAHFSQVTPDIAVKCELWDNDSHTLLNQGTKTAGSELFMVFGWKFNLSDDTKKNLSVKVGFLWTNTSGEIMFGSVGQHVIEAGESQIPCALSITKPRAKNKTVTELLYYRRGSVFDYYYETPTLRGRTAVMLPFAGTLTLQDDGWKIARIADGMTEGFEAPTLWLFVSNGGSVEYSRSMIPQFLIDGKTISWDFNDDWNTIFDEKCIKSNTTLQFFCRFYIRLEKTGQPEHYRYQDVVVSSIALSAGELESVAIIEPIHLSYGCLAEDTNILMADGQEKRVSLIKPTDRVFTLSGSGEVMDVISGNESKLVCIEAENNRLLRVTKGHPVQTKRGFVRADELTAADTLILHGETESRVVSLYAEEYDGKVYNLLTSEPRSPLVANGYMVGDFEMQNSLAAEKNKPVEYSESARAAGKVFKDICGVMERVCVEEIESVISKNVAVTTRNQAAEAMGIASISEVKETGGPVRILTVPAGQTRRIASLLAGLK